MGKYVLNIPEQELNLKNTLINGQCFNWQESTPGMFEGVLHRQYVQLSRPDSATVIAEVSPDSIKEFPQVLMDYFNSSINIEQLHKDWSAIDPHMSKVCQRLPGVRILRQDPWECTISFICSSNNNISRITKLLEALRNTYGQLIHQTKEKKWYAFPSLQQLEKATVQKLREMGFGYRAEYVIEAVQAIRRNGGQKWLELHRNISWYEIRKELTKLKGVGRKVADCICLFSMDCHQAVPVDTHVFQLAKKLGYIGKESDKKSLSDSLYNKIADCYEQKFGKYAGWAQQVLFAGDLDIYKETMSDKPTKKAEESEEEVEQPLKKTRKKKA